MSAMNNELDPKLMSIQVGTQAATITLPAQLIRKKSKILNVTYVDQAGIAADNTNFLQLSLQVGSTVYATLDTRAANNGANTALVGQPLTLAIAEIPANSQLKLVVTKNGTGVPTLGQLYVELFPY